ncbi:MAG: DUF488 family protein [Verrucomicrobia bacterium]|nr:DUF488 family protein [Verrucomicrobiota bacterium]
MIFVKRVYEPARKNDGSRFLVDYLWPSGVSKETLQVERWAKSVAPSSALRKWFGHDPARWEEFQQRYFAELDQKPEAWQPLMDAAREGDITLVFAASDTDHNNAVALRIYLIRHLKIRRSTRPEMAAV